MGAINREFTIQDDAALSVFIFKLVVLFANGYFLVGSDDEAFATLGGMYGVSNNPGGLRHHQMGPIDPDVSYNTSRHVEDPPEDHHLMPYNQDDERSEGGASAMMKGAQEVLKKNRMKRM